MPEQGNASLALAECEGGLRLCINILKVKGSGAFASTACYL